MSHVTNKALKASLKMFTKPTAVRQTAVTEPAEMRLAALNAPRVKTRDPAQ